MYKIPVKVCLPENIEFYIEMSSNSYLPLLFKKLNLLLKDKLVPTDYKITINKNYQDWSIPIGVLKDLYDVVQVDLQPCITSNDDKYVFNHFVNMIKEAEFIRTSSVKRVMGLGVGVLDEIWKSVGE
jgi:Autophagy protein Apg5